MKAKIIFFVLLTFSLTMTLVTFVNAPEPSPKVPVFDQAEKKSATFARINQPGGAAAEICGKDVGQCLVAYFAPWCPHCKNKVADMQRMIKAANDRKEQHVVVVVGAGKEEQNKKMAGLFSDQNVHIDHDQSLAEYLGLRAFPSFYMFEKGRLTGRGQGLLQLWQEKLFP